jgi:lysophospholipase L1-like esterase
MLAQPNVGRSGTPPTHKKILAFGDSLTAGYYNWGRSFNPYTNRLGALLGSEWKAVEVGRSGETTTEMVSRLPAVLKRFQIIENVTFDYILILGGNLFTSLCYLERMTFSILMWTLQPLIW